MKLGRVSGAAAPGQTEEMWLDPSGACLPGPYLTPLYPLQGAALIQDILSTRPFSLVPATVQTV